MKSTNQLFDLKKPWTLPQSLYWSTSYMTPERFSSIGYQWKLACELNKKKILEIGIGNSLLTQLLRTTGINVTTLDINNNLSPEIVGRLPEIPLSSKLFQVSLCYEVLEHLPYAQFIQSLNEISRVTIEFIIISLPDNTPGNQSLRKKIHNLFYKRQLNKLPAEHQWEIGSLGINEGRIINDAQKIGLTLVKHFRNPSYKYHHFFTFKLL